MTLTSTLRGRRATPAPSRCVRLHSWSIVSAAPVASGRWKEGLASGRSCACCWIFAAGLLGPQPPPFPSPLPDAEPLAEAVAVDEEEIVVAVAVVAETVVEVSDAVGQGGWSDGHQNDGADGENFIPPCADIAASTSTLSSDMRLS